MGRPRRAPWNRGLGQSFRKFCSRYVGSAQTCNVLDVLEKVQTVLLTGSGGEKALHIWIHSGRQRCLDVSRQKLDAKGGCCSICLYIITTHCLAPRAATLTKPFSKTCILISYNLLSIASCITRKNRQKAFNIRHEPTYSFQFSSAVKGLTRWGEGGRRGAKPAPNRKVTRNGRQTYQKHNNDLFPKSKQNDFPLESWERVQKGRNEINVIL